MNDFGESCAIAMLCIVAIAIYHSFKKI